MPFGRQALVVILVVLALRLPYLGHAVQGDDLYYLAGAQHALIDPLHPLHARYVFQGDVVSMQGHPHGPVIPWVLGGLLALCGEVREVPFHAAYMVFSLLAGLSALVLARRFSGRPLTATLLFLAVPPFVINGNSFETDVPLVSFWLAATALYVEACERGKAWMAGASVVFLALASLTGYQSVMLVPILLLYSRRYWWALASPLVTIAAFQLWERSATQALPAQVLAGYLSRYGLQSVLNKLRNAGSLTVHLGWLIFPLATLPAHWRWAAPAALAGAVLWDPHPLFWLPFGVGVALLVHLAREARRSWLAQWALLFFAAALVLFFAGSARYLLPLALPLAILAADSPWARPAIGLQFALGAALAFSNSQHWDGYRRLAAEMVPQASTGRVWVNGEWGLRFYLESAGALALLRGQPVLPGEQVVTSALADPIPFTTGGGVAAVERTVELRSTLPVCLICLDGESGYSSARRRLRAFGISRGPLDRVTVEGVTTHRPERSFLKMGDPEASRQIVAGVYELEGEQWRWMADRATVLLRRATGPVAAKIYLPDVAPGRRVTIAVDGRVLLDQTLAGPGMHELVTPPVGAGEGDATVTLTIDKLIDNPKDQRRLGMVLVEIGFRP